MKILLTTLNSQYVHSNPALKYLYTVLADTEADAELREFTINNEPSYVYGEILRANCDMVCFSCYIWNIEQTRALAADLKKADPDLIIALGGPEVSADAHVFMARNPWADFIICGEGEYPFYRLCQVLAEKDGSEKGGAGDVAGGGLEGVPGLVYRKDGSIYVNPQIEPMDFNSIPFLYSILECEADKVVYYESARGCPFSCSYCLSSLDRSVRSLAVDRVKKDIGYFIRKKAIQVKFIDRTFNYDEDRACEIFRYIIENDNGVTNFHFEMRGDLITQKTLSLLTKARKGLFRFEIGIQSANPRTLAAVNRDENVYPALYAAEKLAKLRNVHVHTDLIAGLPFETYDVFARSFDKVYSIGADVIQLGFLKVLKGTPIAEAAERFKIVCRSRAPYEIISNRWISARQLARLKTVEKMVDLFYNRKGFERALAYLMEATEMKPFRLYESLADYYYGRGFQHRDRKKEDNYRILKEYGDSTLTDIQKIEFDRRLEEDLRATLAPEEVRRFLKKGWNTEA